MKQVGPGKGQNSKLPGFSGQERRKNVRVSPADDKEVVLTMDGETYLVSDLSSGGIAFWIPEGKASALNLTQGKQFKIYLKLPNADKAFPLIVAVLARMPNGLLRCAFKKSAPESMLLIQQYIVIRVQESVGLYF